MSDDASYPMAFWTSMWNDRYDWILQPQSAGTFLGFLLMAEEGQDTIHFTHWMPKGGNKGNFAHNVIATDGRLRVSRGSRGNKPPVDPLGARAAKLLAGYVRG